MTKYLVNTEGTTFGKIGEGVPGTHLHVGDVVAWLGDNGKFGASVVVKNESRGDYCIWGWLGTTIEDGVAKEWYKLGHIVVPYNRLDEEVLAVNSDEQLSVKEYTIKKHTLAQIEELLGYKVEIVASDLQADYVPSEEFKVYSEEDTKTITLSNQPEIDKDTHELIKKLMSTMILPTTFKPGSGKQASLEQFLKEREGEE